MKVKRKMVKIDEDKCNGCGLCVPSCAEGALQIIDGKAKLLSDVYCDGLGACLGDCPQGAISIEEREAEEFDEKAVEVHLERMKKEEQKKESKPVFTGCPGMAAKSIQRTEDEKETVQTGSISSKLTNWPVQIKLVSPQAPYLQGASLLIAADCVPFAYADFHRKFVDGRVVLVGCPKLDDADFYIEKLAMIFAKNEIKDTAIPYMEVPCCHGLLRIVELALQKAGKTIPVTATMIGLDGEIRNTREL